MRFFMWPHFKKAYWRALPFTAGFILVLAFKQMAGMPYIFREPFTDIPNLGPLALASFICLPIMTAVGALILLPLMWWKGELG